MAVSDAAARADEDPELQAESWDLEPLVDGEGEAGVDRLLAEAHERAGAFAQSHEGRVADLDPPGLREAMQELAAISELVGRAASYAHLSFSLDTADPARGALLQRMQERATQVQTTLLFFELEWAALPDERAEELLAGEGLDFCRHHLWMERRYRPYLLSQAEERILAEKAVTSRSAWARLFAELTSALRVESGSSDGGDGGSAEAAGGGDGGVSLEVALSRLHSPDRELRRSTAEAITRALEPGLRTRAFLFNTLLYDKAVEDRLRGYPHWLASRNLANEASDESVQALVEAVRRRYDLAQRWYRLKARLLGIDRLADYDRMAAVTEDEALIGWPDARELVLDAYRSFSPDLSNLARRFFDERWIDAPVRPAKRGGAFSASTVPSVHPYVMLNYTGRRRDALTLAHELGHGVHQALAREQGVFHQSTPLTVAETASVFGETVVFGRLLEQADSASSRLALAAQSVEDAIATVFRQVAMNRFEDSVHTSRRNDGELSVDRIGELWAHSQGELLGDSVEITEGYRTWWSYVPHFINTPGYVYAYAYGQLLALSVYRRYLEEGEGFVPRYLEMLAAGGSQSPEELGRIVGVDLTDPGFWDAGLGLVEQRLETAERAAAESGRLPS